MSEHTPSPGTPGEGWGEGAAASKGIDMQHGFNRDGFRRFFGGATFGAIASCIGSAVVSGTLIAMLGFTMVGGLLGGIAALQLDHEFRQLRGMLRQRRKRSAFPIAGPFRTGFVTTQGVLWTIGVPVFTLIAGIVSLALALAEIVDGGWPVAGQQLFEHFQSASWYVGAYVLTVALAICCVAVFRGLVGMLLLVRDARRKLPTPLPLGEGGGSAAG